MNAFFRNTIGFAFFCFLSTYAQETVRLKQINVVKTNYRDFKSGEIVNKTFTFTEGKLNTIKTSDVVQNFFYNSKGFLDRTIKEKIGSNWKEATTYSYDNQDRLIKFTKKYQEGNESVTKTVNINYEGARVKVISQKSTTKEATVDNVEYIVENGIIVRRSVRDRGDQVIGKTEYAYTNGNCTRHKGLLGDTSVKYFTFDDKKSPEPLIAKGLFGDNYKIIIPVMSFHEEEFGFQMISDGNETSFRNNLSTIIKAGKYKYNTLGYPETYNLSEEDGMIKTAKTYVYEAIK